MNRTRHFRMPVSPLLVLLCCCCALLGFGPRTTYAAGILVHDRDDIAPLRIVDHLVSVDIRNQVAMTTLHQSFENTSNQRLEGTYIFPIPDGADITDFRMTFNGQMVEGEVLPADEARQIYESIVRRQRDPGLIEFIGRRLLRARVFPIEPHSTTDIEISYQQVIDHVSGMSRYRYPLRTPGTNGYAYGTVRFSVDLEATAPLRAVWSPSHTVDVARDGDRKARAAFEKSGASLDEDFVLLYDTGDQDVGLSVVSYRERNDEPGHFLLILSPKSIWDDSVSVPQDYVFVVDTSGSMAGEKIDQAKSALKYCINRLSDDDRFSVVRFSTGFDLLFDELRSADGDVRKKAIDKIESFKATGGTNILDAMKQALSLRDPDSERPFVVVFLTDGRGDRPREEVEQMLAETTSGNRAALRIFPFGVGHDVNTKLLDTMATGYGGLPTYVQPGENLEHRLGDFFAVFSEPVLTNVKLSLPDAGISEQYPPAPGDLYHGRQLILAGEFTKDSTGRVVLQGQRGDERVRYEFSDVDFTPTEDAEYVSRIWAGRKIAYLLDRIRLHGESDEMVDEVVKLATHYGIQTPYTSWLVAPESERNLADGGRRVRPAARQQFRRMGRGGGTPNDSAFDMAEQLGAPGEMGREGFFGFSEGGGVEAMEMDAESGEKAVAAASRLARMRAGESVDDTLADQDSLAVRRIAGREFWNLRGVLVDTGFGENTKAIDVKFGSNAYFDLVLGLEKLRPVFSAARSVIIMIDEDTAIVIRPESGHEELTDDLRKQLLGG